MQWKSSERSFSLKRFAREGTWHLGMLPPQVPAAWVAACQRMHHSLPSPSPWRRVAGSESRQHQARLPSTTARHSGRFCQVLLAVSSANACVCNDNNETSSSQPGTSELAKLRISIGIQVHLLHRKDLWSSGPTAWIGDYPRCGFVVPPCLSAGCRVCRQLQNASCDAGLRDVSFIAKNCSASFACLKKGGDLQLHGFQTTGF